MNNFFKFIIILLISSLSAYAQTFEGIATYKTQQKIDFEILTVTFNEEISDEFFK